MFNLLENQARHYDWQATQTKDPLVTARMRKAAVSVRGEQQRAIAFTLIMMQFSFVNDNWIAA